MCTQIGSTALHILWCYLIIIRYEQGIIGAACAICITQTLNFSTLFIYTSFIDKSHSKIWSFSRSAFQEWSGYLKLGIPGTLMIMLDQWCYEIINLESGFLYIEATAA